MSYNDEDNRFEIKKNQMFTTGDISFIVVMVNPVTKWFSRISIKINNSGAFNNLVWDVDCTEIHKGIEAGTIKLIRHAG